MGSAVKRSSLERLSSDPDARRLAEERELSQIVHQHYLACTFERGVEQGREQGIDIGQLKHCRKMIQISCESFNIEFDESKRQLIMALPFEKLERFVERLMLERAWPTDFE